MGSKKNMKDAFDNFEMDSVDSGWDDLRGKMMKEGIESKKEEKDRKPFFFILASVLLLGVGFLIFSESDFKKKEHQNLADSMMQNDKDRIEKEMAKNHSKKKKSNKNRDNSDPLLDVYTQSSTGENDSNTFSEENWADEQGNSGSAFAPTTNNDNGRDVQKLKSVDAAKVSGSINRNASKYLDSSAPDEAETTKKSVANKVSKSKAPSVVTIDDINAVQIQEAIESTPSNAVGAVDKIMEENEIGEISLGSEEEMLSLASAAPDASKSISVTDTTITEEVIDPKSKYANSKGKGERDPVEPEEQKARNWSFSPFYIWDFNSSNNTIVNNDLTGYTSQETKSNTKNQITYTTGFSLGLVVSEKWTIESGVWISQKRPVDESAQLFDDVGADAGSVTYNYHGKYLTIPLRAKRYLKNSKFYNPKEKYNFFVTAGLVFNKTLNSGGSNYYDQNIVGSSFREEIKASQVGIGLTGGGGMEWQFSSHFSVFSELLLQRSLTPVLGKLSDEPVKDHKTKSTGIGAGVVIRF